VSAVECICIDGTAIEPLIIFKGQNVLQSWIPKDVISKWHFSANTKGWTSNLHGLEWLKRVFEPSTREKATLPNGKLQQRLLICDGHDSHISGSFISHCIQNYISLLILPPHTSHILQPLDVAIFGPLKKHLTTALSHLNEAQLLRIQKAEWLEAYIHAREVTFSNLNITSAWRGSGLQPFQPQTVIRAATLQPPTPATPQRPRTPTEHDIFEKVFVNSSPPDFNTLQKANSMLSKALNEPLNSPTKRYIHQLADKTEQLSTHYILQKREVENLRNITQKRKAQKGKRAVLKSQFHISTQELQSQVSEAEAATATQTSKKSTIPQVTTSIIDLIDDETEEEQFDSDMDELGW
jgi:uncharacterized protein YlxP (DUF503 family)